MAGDNSRKEQSALSGAASAAGTARGAIKTGKAIAGAAKGAAAGPYGMLAAGLWENRKAAGKILAAFAAMLMLPILFLLMLPSLIFGSLGLDDATGDALNDNSVIMENIAETEASIEAILRKKHDGLLEEIQQEADALGPGCEYGITDDFSDRIIYESALIISQFCASQDDYREISLAKLERILRDNTDGIFTYTVEVTEYEETDEETGESRTIYHHEYTVEYAGDSYYTENVFHLTDGQMQTAEEYAANLHLFLFDTVYLVEVNPDLIPGETGNKAVDLALTKLGTPYSQEKRTRKILTGTLGGIEKMDGGGTIAVVYYKDMRVVIPLSEMMINLVEDEAHDYGELVQRQNKILGNMLGCEIDFIIKGLENASRSVVASRKDAMYKKRQIFYMPDAAGNSRVCEDRIVQARVIAVAEKVVRVEIFGTECSILARDLSWDWLGDATERFHVGEQILVRILSVKIRSLEDISVKADVKSVNGNTSKENLSKCKIQGKYAGTVTDIHKGTVFVRLHIGVNAVAHSCYDNRMPGKKDDVSFVVTRIDADRNVAVGLISRIIKQNI